jgi:hypothetical protein
MFMTNERRNISIKYENISILFSRMH